MNKIVCSLLSLSMALAFTFVIASPAFAQDGTTETTADWSNFFDPKTGSMQEGVVDAGEIEIEADWMSIPGSDGAPTNNPTYHVYIAANGDSIIAPSYSTMGTMVSQYETSGILEANASTQDLIGLVSSAMEIGQATANRAQYGNSGLVTGNGEAYDIDGDTQVDALSAMLLQQLQNVTWGVYSSNSNGIPESARAQWEVLKNIIKTGIKDHALATTYLYYTADNCANNPIGCQKLCDISPSACLDGSPVVTIDDIAKTIPAPQCPASTITPGTPSLSIYKTGPNSPLVVGQDPNKRGADVAIAVTIPPTVYIYYTQKPIYEDQEFCVTAGTGTGSGTGGVTPNCKTSSTAKKNDGIRVTESVLVRIDCEKHTLVYSEPIASVRASANLSTGSQDWINNQLSQYYYGAHTTQTSFSLIPGIGTASTGCNGSKTCYATGSVTGIPFQDPGQYGLSLRVVTAGTPVSTGRTLNTSGSLGVSFIAVRLIENGSR